MEPKRRADWVDRISKSVQQHESSRRLFLGRIPRYDPIERLGRGGMGAVYRAMDRVLSREVALKVLIDPLGAPAEARSRFLQEARLAATLQHPHIVPIFDAGEHEGQVFLAMQLIDGSGLDRSTLGLREAVSAVRDAARAVHYAHERGIIHRDLKPSNVMVDRTGRVYVTDFGLARRSDSAARMTLTGTIVGTPIYMPPEQARGKETDARSDVYSLGATLYELASGKPPFSGANELEILKHVLLDEPPFPRKHAPSVPQDLEAVIVKAMDKKPTGRYLTAAALADDLDRWLRSEPVEAPVRGTLYWIRKKIMRHRWRVLAIAATIGFLLSSAAFAWAYMKAYRTYRNALNEPDRELKLSMMTEAATYISSARDERKKILKEKEAEDRVARQKVDHQIAADARQRAEERQTARNAQIMANLERDFESALRKSDLVGAETSIGLLRELGFKEIKKLEADLTTTRFKDGVSQLKDFAEGGKAREFREVFAKLHRDEFKDLKDRDVRLIQPCRKLAATLDDQPEEKIYWLTKAESLGDNSPQLYLDRGLVYLKLLRYDEAYPDYLKFRHDPQLAPPSKYADLLVHKASIAKTGKRWKEAREFLGQALAIHAAHPEALFLKSVVEYEDGGTAREALSAFAAARRLDPKQKPAPEHIRAAWNELREVARRTWEMTDSTAAKDARAQAVVLAEPVLRFVSGEPAAPLLELARMRLRLEDLENALKEAERASPSAESHLLRAQIHHLSGRSEKALMEIDESLRINRELAVAWYWRGVTREATAAPDAMDDFKEALRRNFKGPELLTRLSYKAAEDAEPNEAIRLATEALTGPPLSEDEYLAMPADLRGPSATVAAVRIRARALAYRGRGHLQKADPQACLADCKASLDLDPGNLDALYHRGLALLKLKKYDDAILDFANLIELNKRDYQAYAGRGSALWGKKQYDTAKEDFREALKLAPANWKQRADLEFLLKK